VWEVLLGERLGVLGQVVRAEARLTRVHEEADAGKVVRAHAHEKGDHEGLGEEHPVHKGGFVHGLLGDRDHEDLPERQRNTVEQAGCWASCCSVRTAISNIVIIDEGESVHSMVMQRPRLRILAVLRRKIRASALAILSALEGDDLGEFDEVEKQGLADPGEKPHEDESKLLVHRGCVPARQHTRVLNGRVVDQGEGLARLESPMSPIIRPAKFKVRSRRFPL